MTGTTTSPQNLYKVALSMLRGGSLPLLHNLDQRGISLTEFFTMSDHSLSGIFGPGRLDGIDAASRQKALIQAENELKFTSAHKIRPIFITDEDYPLRLAQIEQPPLLIYLLGAANLNSPHPLSVVGTRKVTPYGAEATRRLTREIAEYFPDDLLVVSGLAYGVDSIAHSTALECNVPTVGVLAHGLDTIYPSQHRDLARRIIEAGGALITQYPSGVRPFRSNFLERNRIVAGISDATIVIESEMKGGAMSTARHAFEANRDLFALPGRAGDPMSAGCNHLIRKQRASLITTAADLLEVTGWKPMGIAVRPEHRSLFPELEGDAATIYEYLRFESEPRHIDIIYHFTGISMARLMSLLSDLEFDGVLVRHPGNRFAVAL